VQTHTIGQFNNLYIHLNVFSVMTKDKLVEYSFVNEDKIEEQKKVCLCGAAGSGGRNLNCPLHGNKN